MSGLKPGSMHLAPLGAIAVWLAPSLLFAGPVLHFDQTLGGTGRNLNQSVGWEFNVRELLTVTHLSWFDQDKNGLSTAHEVGLWNPSGELIAQAQVLSGSASALDGIWRLVDIPDLVLGVADGYVIGGTNSSSSSDRLVAGLFPIDLDLRVEHVETRFSDFGTVLVLPNMNNSATSAVGFYGPGFNVEPIPEPQTVTLLLLGVAVLLPRRR